MKPPDQVLGRQFLTVEFGFAAAVANPPWAKGKKWPVTKFSRIGLFFSRSA